jgi:uncharacterized protein (DUF2141 family)
MANGTIKDIGSLKPNEIQFRNASMTANGFTETDIYKFKIEGGAANVSISTGFLADSPFALALFQDRNNSGVLDNGDSLVQSSDKGKGILEAMETINTTLSEGTYFARARSFVFDDFNYTFLASRAATGTANPLATPETQLGTVAQDLQKRDRVSNSDTADNFAFTLDGSSGFNINVRELGRKKGDVNIRVVQDLDGDGAVDKNEVVSLGTSSSQGNVDTITGMNKAGDYILQVCQTQGKTKFEVNFDPTAA